MAKNSGEVSMDRKLIEVYKTHGIKTFLNVCSEMLNIKDKADWEKKKKSNGEVCEVVLRVLSEHYLKTRKLQGTTFHSMVLSDLRNPKSDFKTELDFTLLTPSVCLTGECKSFVGDIVVTGDCTLTRDEMQADVAKQSLLHGRCLKLYLEKFAKAGINMTAPPFGLFCFVYSNGTLADRRTTSKKNLIPVLTVSTLYSYYDQVFKQHSKEVYRYAEAQKEFKKLTESKALHAAHKAYLGY